MSARSELILQKLLGLLVSQKAQELHLIPGGSPVLRHDGELEQIKGEETLTEEFVLNLAKEFMSSQQLATLEKQREIVFTREISSLGRFRVRAYYQKGSLSLNFKRIEQDVPSLTELGVPAQLEALRHMHRGLIIVSGPYDSGRSFLAASLLQTINRERSARIMTLEQSIEFIITSNKSIVEQREVGRDVMSLQEGLKVLSDEDVDVVFVPDVAGVDVARPAVRLALAGKLVVVATTSDSAIRALESFVGGGSQEETRQLADELADALGAVINLRLVKRSGQAGRVYAVELLLNNLNVKIALKGLDFRRVESILYASREEGMQTLDQNLLELVHDGQIAAESALKIAHNSKWLGEQLGK